MAQIPLPPVSHGAGKNCARVTRKVIPFAEEYVREAAQASKATEHNRHLRVVDTIFAALALAAGGCSITSNREDFQSFLEYKL